MRGGGRETERERDVLLKYIGPTLGKTDWLSQKSSRNSDRRTLSRRIAENWT
jgi:hypothetical protein